MSEAMNKRPAKKKTAAKAKPKAARDYFPPVPASDPIYLSGFAVGGRYPARKLTERITASPSLRE